MNKLIDFNTFDDIEHKPLQAYNRAVFFSNLLEDQGKAFAEDYIAQFSAKDRLKMANVISAVKRFGLKKVQQIVTEGVEFPENMADQA